MRISTMRDVLEFSAIDHVYYRTYSPLVRCVGREYTPVRSSQIAMLVAGGRLQWTPDVVEAMYWSFNSRIERVRNMDAAGDMFDVDDGLWDRPARADVVDAGKAPEFVKKIEANVKATGNVYGIDDDPSNPGKADVVYIADDITRAKCPEVALAVQKVLENKGVNFVTLAKGTDGWALYDLGLWALAEEKAKEFFGFIQQTGAKTIVANNPATVYAIKEWYPTLGLKFDGKVYHHTECFERLGVTGKFEGKVTFHDPSYLVRYLMVEEAPRKLLANVEGLELKECYFKGPKANPTGPLVAFFNDEWAEAVADRRAEELALAAPVVVTASPTSKRDLNKVAEAKGIKVFDIAEVLAGTVSTAAHNGRVAEKVAG